MKLKLAIKKYFFVFSKGVIYDAFFILKVLIKLNEAAVENAVPPYLAA
jgi:hypothetical protein